MTVVFLDLKMGKLEPLPGNIQVLKLIFCEWWPQIDDTIGFFRENEFGLLINHFEDGEGRNDVLGVR